MLVPPPVKPSFSRFCRLDDGVPPKDALDAFDGDGEGGASALLLAPDIPSLLADMLSDNEEEPFAMIACSRLDGTMRARLRRRFPQRQLGRDGHDGVVRYF
jgi:hypothetical protein